MNTLTEKQAENNVARLATLNKYKKINQLEAETFSERLGGSATVAEFLAYLCQFIDLALCSLGLFVALQSLVNIYWISFSLSVAGAVAFEALKRYFFPISARHIIQNWVAYSRYRWSFLFCFILAGGGFLGSYIYAVAGSAEAVRFVRSNIAPPAYISDSSATGFIDGAIALKAAEMKKYEYGLGGKDWTVSTNIYPQLSSQYAGLISKRDSILKENKAQNEKKYNTWVEQGTKTSGSIWWLGLITLGGFLLLRTYVEYFYKQALTERPEWIENILGKNRNQQPKTETAPPVNPSPTMKTAKTETAHPKKDPKTPETTGEQKPTTEELRSLSSTARVYWKRGKYSKSEKAKANNKAKAEQLFAQLRSAGASIEDDPLKGLTIILP